MIEEHLRLLGEVSGRKVLELGFSQSCSALELAGRGAVVIAVDPSAGRVDAVRRLAADESVRLELHHGELADLAFVRADTVDVVLADGALDDVADPDRLLRQANRVLRHDGLLLFGVRHPAAGPGSYFDGRTFGTLFASLQRTDFRVDHIVEPEPYLVVRARKLGA
ncbi:MAG TPA: class I SAM-dependent methyltransferase [Acidimicrobiales bacterium]